MSTTGDKWLRLCYLIRSSRSGKVKIDVLRFKDVTSIGETEGTLIEYIESEIPSVPNARCPFLLLWSHILRHPTLVRRRNYQKSPDLYYAA